MEIIVCTYLDYIGLYSILFICLCLQAFTAFGPTVIQPTWFLHRSVYTAAGPYKEDGPGTPEDLQFFYNHLSIGGRIHLVDKELLVYRYHKEATSMAVDR